MKRLFSHTGDRVAFWSLIALVVITLIVSALRQYAGLALVQGEVYIFLPLIIVALLIGWGFSGIFRRIRQSVVRVIVGVVMVLIMLAILTVGVTYAGYAASFSFPARYADMESPNMHNHLMVMRGLDLNEERINARHAARLAADPEASEEIVAEDWGYVFTAYAPGPLGLFYKVNTLQEGEVYIGFGSKAELMVEWEEDETVGHFYVKNPEAVDSGEMRVSVK